MNNASGRSWVTVYGGKLLKDYSYLLSFALLLVVAYINNTNFFNWRNITNIFVQSGTSSGIIAFGMTMVICAGMIDISVGAQVAIVSGMSISVFNDLITHFPALDGGLGVVSMLIFCLVFGLLIGTFNGLLVAKGHVPAMIATLAVQTACRSLINYAGKLGPFSVANGNSQTTFYQTFRLIAAGSINVFGFKIPYPMLMFIAIGLLFGLIMQRTKLGKHIYAVGSNETSARLAGVNVDR
jgi:ribose transport system permease protein